MASSEITVGILSPSEDTRELLRIQVNATGQASAQIEADVYCSTQSDRSARLLLEAAPDIIIVDMHDPQAALLSLHVLHAALPETWLFVCSAANNPQLIIETMRAGAREFLPSPIPPATLSQALGRFIAEKQYRQHTVGKIYCITSAKGGVGATSLSINVAASLVGVPKTHVALIDLNSPVGDTAAHLNLKPQFTVSEALASAARLDPVLLESYVSHAHGIAVLPGPRDFRSDFIPGADALARVLEVIAQTYTHAFVDLASSLSKEYVEIVTGMSTTVVVVSTTELPALWRTERLLRFLATCGMGEKVRLVINRAHKSDEVTDSEIERVLKLSPYWKLPNNYRGSIKAILSGHPLVSENHSDLAASYRALAHRLTDIPLPDKKRGLFGIFSN
ncbi:MAG: hypothetical protein WAV20_06545 [Blastocatellia bacterium]